VTNLGLGKQELCRDLGSPNFKNRNLGAKGAIWAIELLKYRTFWHFLWANWVKGKGTSCSASVTRAVTTYATDSDNIASSDAKKELMKAWKTQPRLWNDRTHKSATHGQK